MKPKNKKILAASLAVLLLTGGGFAIFKWKEGGTAAPEQGKRKIKFWANPMDPSIHSDHPMKDNMGMDYVPVYEDQTAAAPTTGKRKIKFWANPMDPSIHSDHPMKDNMGMDYVPVYEDQASSGASPGMGVPAALKGLAPVSFSVWQQQLIGMRTDTAQVRTVTRVIRTVGRFAGGSSDFASAAGDFAALGRWVPRKARYVVADVYDLDFPYVRVGQKAWVSSFSGSGPRLEGRVTRIYPYDQTQSRVRQVRIDLEVAPPPGELFDNVEIEASSKPVLSVPREAVMQTGLRSFVFVEKSPNAFVPVEVTVGFQGDRDWQVLSGLEEGATVVDGANFELDADSQLQANFDSMSAQ